MGGLLSRAFGGAREGSPRQEMKEAIAYFVVLMIHADGSVGDDEVNVAMGTLARCRLFSDNTNQEDFALLTRMERKMQQDADGLTGHYAQVLAQDGWKYTAAAILSDIMLSDGDIDQDEVRLLKMLCDRAGITEDELDAIVATVRAMRRAWTN